MVFISGIQFKKAECVGILQRYHLLRARRASWILNGNRILRPEMNLSIKPESITAADYENTACDTIRSARDCGDSY